MTTATQLPLEGYAPGIHQIDAEAYHADRTSLSSSGARKLLAPSCPAKFKWDLDHPPEPKKHFDLGHAAHRLVLGDGPDLAVVEADNWTTKAARQAATEIRAEGAVPLLRDTYEQVHEMAEALRQHPLASALLDPASGTPEQSLFWRDRESGVNCRARLDWLPHAAGGRLIVPDYKSARNASEVAFRNAVKDYGYHQQADFYMDAVRALEIAEDPAFVFIVQEVTAPFLVNVIELSGGWLLMAADRNKRAREVYAACTATGIWPGYSSDVVMVDAPAWLETEHEREYR